MRRSSNRFFRTLLACLFMTGFTIATTDQPAFAGQQVAGRYLQIVSDLDDDRESTQLAAAFDAAVPLWCDFLNIDPARLDGWHVTAFVMESTEAMRAAGVLNSTLPAFHSGIQRGRKLWVVRQPSEYYTRHLLLHEGVHALMNGLFGDAGPGWYQEGMAELLATHDWDGQTMQLPVVPGSRQAAPYWGRFKELDRRRKAGKALAISSLMRYRNSATDTPEPYAWTWAMTSLSRGYPEFRRAILAMTDQLGTADTLFNRRFRSQLDDWQRWNLRWRILIDEFDYGYDLRRNALRLASPLDASRFSVTADRGWQDTGVAVKKGQLVSIKASGAYVIGTEPKPWRCEPQGVTIRYHRGHPLGMLLATVADEGVVGDLVRPLVVEPVGREHQFESTESGTLLLRIGDDPAQLADNSGSTAVKVSVSNK